MWFRMTLIYQPLQAVTMSPLNTFPPLVKKSQNKNYIQQVYYHSIAYHKHNPRTPLHIGSVTNQTHLITTKHKLHPFVTLLLTLRLLLSGDIETNPGPFTRQSISIVHANVCSLRNKIDLVQTNLGKHDIITLSETWLDDTVNNDSISLQHFHPPVRQDRPNNAHGGVAIYVKNTLVCKARPDLHVPGLDAVWVETKLNQDTLLVGSFYRSPDSNVSYWSLIKDSIERADSHSPTKMMILGDFNSDYNNPSKHLKDIQAYFDLDQLVDSPTRITDTKSSCIDLILTPNPGIVESTEVLPPFCSDHCILNVKLRQKTTESKPFQRTIHIYSELNAELLTQKLSNTNWIFTENETIDDAAKIFSETLYAIARECMPSKNITIRPRDADWMNDEIRLLMKRRDKAFKDAKKFNSPYKWTVFKQLRNEVNAKIKKAKSEHDKELDKKISEPSLFGEKQWWKLVKTFMNKKGIDTEIPPIEENGTTYYTNTDKANVLNNYFIQQSTLNPDTTELPNTFYEQPELNNIIIRENETLDVLKNLDAGKAVGPDMIHNKLLSAGAQALCKPLTHLFNRCLQNGKYPSIWKTAHVTPIHKKGSRENCTNYRPISLLSCVGKAFERCIHKHILTFITENSIITPSQSGFLPGDSTIFQLLSTYDDICRAYDNKSPTQSIFFDISKAFDRVWHRGLIYKLKSIGIRGKLLDFLSDYLTQRKQAVVLKGEKSNYREVTAGVPQGSVLGPLLFLIYINDITDNIASTIKLFADDTSIYTSSSNAEERQTKLNSDLQTINNWALTWKAEFSEEKTKLLNFTRTKSTDFLPLNFGNTILHETTSHKHLGLTFQNNCKWNEHVQQLVRKCTLLVGCLRSLKHRLNRKSLEHIYKAFILPHFDYADILWDNCTERHSNMLENLQLDSLRTITGAVRGTSHEKLYKETGFMPLQERRKLHKLCTLHKIINGNCPDYLQQHLPPLASSVNPYHRRRPFDRLSPAWDIEAYRLSFFPSTISLWNTLPQTTQQTTSLSAFKRKLQLNNTAIPTYMYDGDRFSQIQHCRMRLGMSDLQCDLVNRHIATDPNCRCARIPETAKHFLLHCPNFTHIRAQTISTLPLSQQTVHVLLNGDNHLTRRENEHLFKTVHTFIKQSNRLR